jgi:hypothetical protein
VKDSQEGRKTIDNRLICRSRHWTYDEMFSNEKMLLRKFEGNPL